MMNKGRIHGDLGKILRYSWNLIKSNDKMSWELRDFSIFQKKTSRQIQKVKNYSIWICIGGTIKEQNQGIKIYHEERANIKKIIKFD